MFVNPRQPADAVLVPGTSWGNLAIALAGVDFLAVAVLLMQEKKGRGVGLKKVAPDELNVGHAIQLRGIGLSKRAVKSTAGLIITGIDRLDILVFLK